MKYYQEITLLDSDEKSIYEIWSEVYMQLHIALADVKNKCDIDTIGVSLPNYRYEEKKGQVFAMLGNKLRIFAQSQKDLETLNLDKWLERLTDYVHAKGIKEVPMDKVKSHVSVHRYRFKPVEVQAQTLSDKLQVGYDEAMAIVAKRKSEMALPFIQMRSQTNNHNYQLKVLQQPCTEANAGSFNTYGMNGMSSQVTVPHW